MNFDDYLSINWAALEGKEPAEVWRILGDLAEGASRWVTDQRGEWTEELRAERGLGDAAMRELLGVSRAALDRAGDGPMTVDGVRPRLLKRGAELLLEHTDVQTEALMRALEVLSKRGRPSLEDQKAAARRIALAGKTLGSGDLEAMSRAERALVSRAIMHAVQVAEGIHFRPSTGPEQ